MKQTLQTHKTESVLHLNDNFDYASNIILLNFITQMRNVLSNVILSFLRFNLAPALTQCNHNTLSQIKLFEYHRRFSLFSNWVFKVYAGSNIVLILKKSCFRTDILAYLTVASFGLETHTQF